MLVIKILCICCIFAMILFEVVGIIIKEIYNRKVGDKSVLDDKFSKVEKKR